MINLKEYKNNIRKYPYISKFIYNFLLRYKKDFPKNIKVTIYDFYSLTSNNRTGISSERLRNGHFGKYELDINLKQILELYTGREEFSVPGRDIPGKIKGFKNYLRFVILHELGHYKIQNKKSYFANINTFTLWGEELEITCDKFAYETLQAGNGQLFFIWG